MDATEPVRWETGFQYRKIAHLCARARACVCVCVCVFYCLVHLNSISNPRLSSALVFMQANVKVFVARTQHHGAANVCGKSVMDAPNVVSHRNERGEPACVDLQ